MCEESLGRESACGPPPRLGGSLPSVPGPVWRYTHVLPQHHHTRLHIHVDVCTAEWAVSAGGCRLNVLGNLTSPL